MPGNHEKPPLIYSLLELRAPLEAITLLSAMRLLKKAPIGDGQPVLVIPGFMTGDGATYILRRYLNKQGFVAYPWEQGRNPGLRHDFYLNLEEKVQQLYNRHGRPVSIVGWSLGGLYARVLGHRLPDKVRQVITLGSPFALDSSVSTDDVGISGPVLRLYERLNPNLYQDPLATGEPVWEEPPPVPSSAIYSESDGIASWRYCIDDSAERAENIRIFGSHTGLTHNPLALYVIAERLAQPERFWRPFQPQGLQKALFREPRNRRPA